MLFLRQNLLRIFRFPVKKRIFRGRTYRNSIHLRTSIQPVKLLCGKSRRKHNTSIYSVIGCNRTSRTYCNTYIYTIDSTRNTIFSFSTSCETTMPAVHPMRMVVRTNQYHTLSFQNIISITQEKLKPVLLIHLFHRIRKNTNITFRHHCHLNDIYSFRFRSSTCSNHHLLSNL